VGISLDAESPPARRRAGKPEQRTKTTDRLVSSRSKPDDSRMTLALRLARESDAAQILTIYAPIVRGTPISFETEVPSEDEMRERIRATGEFAPWLVCEESGEVIGYAYATRFRARAAYQWTVEVTVYVHSEHKRQGVARALYTRLIGLLCVQGFESAIAVIVLPNDPSVALHERLGFEKIGVLPATGFKLGAWHETGWWRLALGAARAPEPPRTPRECARDPRWLALLDSPHA
jgi:L-amino acid N-acyltransferase YncA